MSSNFLLDGKQAYHHTADHSLERRASAGQKTAPSDGILTKQNRVITLVAKGRTSNESHVRIVGIQASQFGAVSVQTKWRAAERILVCEPEAQIIVCAHSFAFPPTPIPLCHRILARRQFHARALDTSLLGVKTAQKLSKGLTVKNV